MTLQEVILIAVGYLTANLLYEAVKHFATKKKREKEFAERVKNIFHVGVTFGRTLDRKEGQSGTVELYGVKIDVTSLLVPASQENTAMLEASPRALDGKPFPGDPNVLMEITRRD